jgi:glycosyltransferase involved in cell wall biosynthesis
MRSLAVHFLIWHAASVIKNPLVSVLTPTQNRRPFIVQYLKYLRRQDYAGPVEILLADDGEDAVGDLVRTDPRIRYLRAPDRMPLGAKRNWLAAEAKGAVLVHMDDDDYYPVNRISHAVTSLLTSDHLIAASSQLYLYDVLTDKITVSGPFGPNHGTAGTFAYRREYLASHSFPETAGGQEEPGFTENFSVPMKQLDPLSTMLVIQHRRNTWNKTNTSTRPTTLKLKQFVRDIDDRRFYRSKVAKLAASGPTALQVLSAGHTPSSGAQRNPSSGKA